MEATIQKWGNSLAIRLPKVVAEQIQVAEGDNVDLQVDEGGLLIRTQRLKYRLSDLLRKITESNLHEEADWGASRGRENW
jgi:antitoxin MazE